MKRTGIKNEKVGCLGETFIGLRLKLEISFDEAWDDWQIIQDKLMFILECPEVRFYDDRRISDARERKRIREYAKSKLGKDIRSRDVSMLGRVAAWLGVEVPVRPYHMDRNAVAEWLARRARVLEMEHGMTQKVTEAIQLSESEEEIDALAADMERFAEDHSLWAVPSERLIDLFLRHHMRLLETSFVCSACNEDIMMPVEHSAGDWQRFKTTCPKCGCWNLGYMFIDSSGEAQVMWCAVDEGDTEAT